ncbi:amidase [Rothia sp. ZJ1223]|uniref:amidase n=1 Tax=Rothia sp. ZJ1223 TaxID=2811098 RepID=UPI0019563202|nr:amidase [Rothia sp. ZJ1223]
MNAHTDHPSWWGISLAELRDQVISGERSAAQLVRESLKRLNTYNAAHRIVLELNRQAEHEAQQVDEAIAFCHAEGDIAQRAEGALAGIPVVVKGNIAVRGLALSAGNPVFGQFVVEQDAPAVATLRNAGAIVLATVNTSEFAWHGTITASSLGGTTTNAYDESLSASGSSGASAVAVALGITPIAVGTDTCGSVVGPAAHAGLVGWRPTFGTLPTEGIVPLAPAQDTPGIIARSVADIQLVAGTLNLTQAEVSSGETARGVARPLRISYLEWPLQAPGAPSLTGSQRQKIRSAVAEKVRSSASLLMQREGMQEVECTLSAQEAHQLLPGSQYTEIALALEEFVASGACSDDVDSTHELVAHALKTALIDSATVERWLKYARTHPEALAESLMRGAEQRRAWLEYMRANSLDAIIYATSPETASHDWAGTAAAGLSSHGGSPSITVPIGKVNGLPVGLTVLTQPDADALAMNIAGQLERLISTS